MAFEAVRVTLVTGAGSPGGIGFATARALAAGGARVAITATSDRIHDRARELGCLSHIADLTDPAQVAGLVAAVEARLGPVEILVNNAGMVQTGKAVGDGRLAEIDDAAWAHHMALNLNTTFHCCRAVLPGMAARGFGRIVNVASVTGPLVTFAGAAGYSSNVVAFWESGRELWVDKAQPQREQDHLFEAAGPGCTYVLTSELALAAQALAREQSSLLARLKYHDWLVYALARARGWRWVIDPESRLRYR
ncbi:MAG: SDR family NAD(P)-dependent oxidoreductase, partial [Acetobacteraceae bacterium]